MMNINTNVLPHVKVINALLQSVMIKVLPGTIQNVVEKHLIVKMENVLSVLDTERYVMDGTILPGA